MRLRQHHRLAAEAMGYEAERQRGYAKRLHVGVHIGGRLYCIYCDDITMAGQEEAAV